MKCLGLDLVTAAAARRGAIRAGEHDEMFLSMLPAEALGDQEAALRKINEMFQSASVRVCTGTSHRSHLLIPLLYFFKTTALI